MIKNLLARDEGKALECKENCYTLAKICQAAFAFANTTGGEIVIGFKDKTKDFVGLKDPKTEIPGSGCQTRGPRYSNTWRSSLVRKRAA